MHSSHVWISSSQRYCSRKEESVLPPSTYSGTHWVKFLNHWFCAIWTIVQYYSHLHLKQTLQNYFIIKLLKTVVTLDFAALLEPALQPLLAHQDCKGFPQSWPDYSDVLSTQRCQYFNSTQIGCEGSYWYPAQGLVNWKNSFTELLTD